MKHLNAFVLFFASVCLLEYSPVAASSRFLKNPEERVPSLRSMSLHLVFTHQDALSILPQELATDAIAKLPQGTHMAYTTHPDEFVQSCARNAWKNRELCVRIESLTDDITFIYSHKIPCLRFKSGLSSKDIFPVLPQLSFIRSLTIENLNLTAEDIAVVENFNDLRTLNIKSNKIGDKGIDRLPQFIVDLDVRDNQISTVGIRSLLKLGHLERLDVSYNDLGSRGNCGMFLAALQNLSSLAAESCNLKDESIASVRRLTNLRSLNLASNRLTGSITGPIGELTQLETLILRHNPLGPESTFSLTQLTQLTTLHINNCNLGTAGFAPLARLTGLRTLRANNNRLTDDILNLVDSFTRLTNLSIMGTDSISSETRKKIEEKLPNTKVF